MTLEMTPIAATTRPSDFRSFGQKGKGRLTLLGPTVAPRPPTMVLPRHPSLQSPGIDDLLPLLRIR